MHDARGRRLHVECTSAAPFSAKDLAIGLFQGTGDGVALLNISGVHGHCPLPKTR
jgi:hypothetical protein